MNIEKKTKQENGTNTETKVLSCTRQDNHTFNKNNKTHKTCNQS